MSAEFGILMKKKKASIENAINVFYLNSSDSREIKNYVNLNNDDTSISYDDCIYTTFTKVKWDEIKDYFKCKIDRENELLSSLRNSLSLHMAILKHTPQECYEQAILNIIDIQNEIVNQQESIKLAENYFERINLIDDWFDSNNNCELLYYYSD